MDYSLAGSEPAVNLSVAGVGLHVPFSKVQSVLLRTYQGKVHFYDDPGRVVREPDAAVRVEEGRRCLSQQLPVRVSSTALEGL